MKYYTKEWYNSTGKRFYTSGLEIIPDKIYSDKEIKQFYKNALQAEVERDRELYNTPPSFYHNEELLTPENFKPENYLIVDEQTGKCTHPKTLEELKVVLEQERKEAEEHFQNRPPFDETETVKCFKEIYRSALRYGKFHYPSWVIEEVDKRFLALNLITQSAYTRLKKEEDEYKEKIERYEEEAAQVLQNQDIPEEIYYKFNFHDADVLALKKIRSDVELYLNRDGMQLEGETPYTKVIFKNVSMLDREKGLVFRKKRKNDGEIGSSCQFLYHELYRTAEYYEVHMMFWTPKALRYLTIKCGDIEIVGNIEYPFG